MKRHVHMLDLDRPSRPRLHKSSCKDCVAREAENERLTALARKLIEELQQTPNEIQQLQQENERLREKLVKYKTEMRGQQKYHEEAKALRARLSAAEEVVEAAKNWDEARDAASQNALSASVRRLRRYEEGKK